MSSPSPRPSAATPLGSSKHLLAFKVLRSTKPSLVSQSVYEQAYEDGAGAAAFRELVKGGGGAGGGGMLRVPAEFGRIYLGETFSAVLSLSNDSPSSPTNSPDSVLAHAPVLKVEIHTSLNPQTGQPTNKHLLATVSPTSAEGLIPGSSTETTVSHELKELGQHALVCTVQYGQEVEVEGGEKRVVSRSFRKVYKFDVASPLSVRTKAHSPPSTCASSSLSPTQRSLIFLEVQVHNHHASSLFFERMRFEPLLPEGEGEGGLKMAEGFPDPNEGLFDGAADALLPPGGVRQFLYVLDQSEEERKRAEPGTNQGLGRLDIIWRTPHGEVGRLQSSTLGRRIPPLSTTAPPPPTAVQPLHVGGLSTLQSPSTATPVQPALQAGGPAPYRPSASRSSTPQPEPAAPAEAPPPPAPLQLPIADGLVFDFTVDDLSAEEAATIQVDRPFRLHFRLGVTSILPPVGEGASLPPMTSLRKRRLRLAAQHVQHHPPALSSPFPTSSQFPPASASRRSHASQSSATLILPGSFAPSASSVTAQQPPRASLESLPFSASSAGVAFPPATTTSFSSPSYPQPTLEGILLPPPFPLSSPSPVTPSPLPSPELVRLGPQLVDLGWIEVGNANGKEEEEEVKWGMRFLSRSGGLKRVGGLRVLLVEVDEAGEEKEDEGREEQEKEEKGEKGGKAARVVGEWDVVAEVWVAG
ncbi:hypothetical protein JCM11251_004714 [Rhodosporidiobolus azoricus]